MAEDCTRSSRRLILLDYDGTLVPFAERLEKATPDNELLGILGGFAQEWFGSLDVGTGRRTRRMGQRGGRAWEIIEPLKNNWKKEIRPIWHYRKADPELGVMRARELKDALLHLIANLNLGVLDGNKVIEVKSAGIDKGRAVLCWISRRVWDSVLAIGDDRIDEDVFAALPELAYSIGVGACPSKARFYLLSPHEVRRLLRVLVGGQL